MNAFSKNRIFHILAVYFFIFTLWTVYRIFFSLPEWFDEFVAKPIVWILPIIFIGKSKIITPFKSTQLSISKNIILGLTSGILYFILYTLISSIKTGFPSFNPMHFHFNEIILQLLIALSTGLIEEIVFRRYILEELLIICNDRIISNSLTTLLFTVIHLPIIIFVYKYPFGASVSYLFLIGLSGFIYGEVYLQKKSLTASTLTHAAWNFLGTMIR